MVGIELLSCQSAQSPPSGEAHAHPAAARDRVSQRASEMPLGIDSGKAMRFDERSATNHAIVPPSIAGARSVTTGQAVSRMLYRPNRPIECHQTHVGHLF